MEERYEIINYPDDIPVRVFHHRLGSVPKHWHESLELLFVLTGEVHAVVDDQTIILKTSDLLVINSCSIHELFANDSYLIALQINLQEIDIFKQLNDTCFDCCSSGKTDDSCFDNIRFLLARLIKASDKSESISFSFAIICLIINELVSGFQTTRKANRLKTHDNLDRMSNIIRFINHHFQNSLTLKEVASNFHLSVPYLSRFFKKHMRMNFTDYYNNIRLEHAVNDLLSCDDPISVVALNNGFPNPRAFVSLFKKKYGTLPSTYRRENSSPIQHKKIDGEINYLAVANSSSLSTLAKYLNSHTESVGNYIEKTEDSVQNIDIGTLPINIDGKKLKHNFRKICCVGCSRDLLNGEVQGMLISLQNDIHFEYVKFHGLLSDDMMVYDEKDDGTPLLSFVLIDKVIDFLLSIGLKPLVQLSFMPKKLASDPEKLSFFIEYNTSPPKDIAKWTYLVKSLTVHLIERYGEAEVLTWPFCVWNEPDTSSKMFGFDNKEGFFNLYKHTYKAVKEVDPRIVFGSPSLLMLTDDPYGWYQSFFDYCNENNCLPQFLNVHYYEDNFCSEEFMTVKVSYQNRLNTDKDSFSHFISKLEQNAISYHIKDVPIYLTEWNLTVNHRNLINDTCYKACYIAKNLLENYDRLQSFGYWSLTDFMCEQQPSDQLYHGGLGLFTINGIPKATYNVFCLLSKLGDILISSGNGWFITKSERSRKIQIMLYNYIHYTNIFASGELFDMTATNRYTCFNNLSSLSFSLNLTEVMAKSCIVRELFVNRTSGSSFDTWVKMGATPVFSNEDFATLKCHSSPGLYIHEEAIHNHTLNLSFKLEPLEVRLIEISI